MVVCGAQCFCRTPSSLGDVWSALGSGPFRILLCVSQPSALSTITLPFTRLYCPVQTSVFLSLRSAMSHRTAGVQLKGCFTYGDIAELFSAASVAFLLPTTRGGESRTLPAAEWRRAGREGDRGGSLKSPAVGERVPWRPATHSPQQGLPGMCQALLGTSAFLWVLPVWLRSWWRGGQRAKRSGGRNSRGQGTARWKARP